VRPTNPCLEFSEIIPSSTSPNSPSAFAEHLSWWNRLSFSMQSSLQYLTYLHLQTDRRMFLLLHHSQMPICNVWPFLNLNTKVSDADCLYSIMMLYSLFRFSWLNRSAEFINGSRHCPGKSIPLLNSTFAAFFSSSSVGSGGFLNPSETSAHLASKLESLLNSFLVYSQNLTSFSSIA